MDGALRRWGLLALLAVTAAGYAGALRAGLAWDDHALVRLNPAIADLRNVPGFFYQDLWDAEAVDSGYYRPLMLISLAVDHALFGLSPAGYHAHSVLWHLAAVALLHRLLATLLGPAAALGGAAIFALHPLQSEAVVWISARNDPMAATLGLGALLLALPRDAAPSRLIGAGVLAFLAALAKESVLLLPLALPLLDLAQGGRGPWRRLIALMAGMAAAVGLRLAVAQGAPAPEHWALLLRKLPAMLAEIGRLLVSPWPLSGGRSLEWLDPTPLTWILGGLTALGLALGALRLPPGRRGLAGAGLALAALSFAPTLVPLAARGLIGERYLYLPLAGLALWIAAFFGPRAPVLAAGLALPWLALVGRRLPDWDGDLSLWEAAVRDTPNPYTHAGLGHALNGEGRHEEATIRFVSGLSGDPSYLGACSYAIAAAIRAGRPQLAVQIGWWSLERGCPRDDLFLGRMGAAYAASCDAEGLRRALADAPAGSDDPWLDLARAAAPLLAGAGAPAEPGPDAASDLDASARELLRACEPLAPAPAPGEDGP